MSDAIYRDPSATVDERVRDLLARMTLAEKAGQMFHTMIVAGPGGALHEGGGPFPVPPTTDMVTGRHMTHFNVLASPPTAHEFAVWHNNLQRLAAATRLGIPVTISSDPRHGFTDNPGTALLSGPFSQWPETLGLAATRDEGLCEQHADIARREYLAVGIRVALHPQVDIATEPRWARTNGTFGEDVELTARMGAAYVRGMQGTGEVAGAQGEPGTFGHRSVSAMAKHFPGGGPQKDGEDPHFDYGREQVYPGGAFETHLRPFPVLIEAGVRQMMPYYGMPVGLVADAGHGPEPIEEVGFGFNRQVVTGMLRERLGFDGIVCTDWGLITDAEMFGVPFPARAWGVEDLSPLDRVVKALEAGVDQFGGEACPELVVEAVESGRVGIERIDASVGRLLREKFELGLFDDARYVDEDAADELVASPEAQAAGRRAQSRAITVLANAASGPARLPIAGSKRVYLEGFADDDPGDGSGGASQPVHSARAVAYGYGLEVTRDVVEADVAVLRLKAPFEQRGAGFESFFHAGSLDFPAETIEHVAKIAARVPTIVDVYLDRPAILAPLVDALGDGGSLVVDFGAGAPALFDALTGRVRPEGRLPFDIPLSMAAVRAGREDVPFDTAEPLFHFGDGVEI